MALPRSMTTVTRLSKVLALILFIILPLITFGIGVKYGREYQRSVTLPNSFIQTNVSVKDITPTLDIKEK
jgi:hypothetical protein